MTQTERLRIKRDCDEVFPQIIIGSGDTIKNVSKIIFDKTVSEVYKFTFEF